MSDKSISELLRAVDPAQGGRDGLDARARQDLGRILRSAPPRNDRRPRLVAALVAGLAALALSLAQPWASPSGPGNPQAGTPPMLQYVVTDKAPAKDQLRAFARRVAALPDEPATGPVLRIKLKAWYLYAGEDQASYLEPQRTTNYVADGRRSWDDSDGESTEVSWQDPLSTDPAVLADQLRRDHENSIGPLLNGIADLHKEAAPGPKVRAALLTVLANRPEIRAEGSVTDRDGRPGVAFSITSAHGGLPNRTTYIFDPVSGVLLDIEQVLTETAGKLNVPIPSVISYEVYESRDYVTEVPR